MNPEPRERDYYVLTVAALTMLAFFVLTLVVVFR